MKTKKQEELIDAYLLEIEDTIRPLYLGIVKCLSEFGYNPKKEKAGISFKHALHNKQIAKMGIKTNKKYGASPYFSLRFSACPGYSQRFTDILSDYIVKFPTRAARCISGNCNFCAGEPSTHVYKNTFPNGEYKMHCGAYALEIPDITAEDIDEIKRLIREEHEYLMEYETNR